MRTRICFLFALCPLLALAEPDAKLPEESRELLGKLVEFEAAEREKLEAELGKKRDQVTTLLKQHLEKATKAGDLEGALAIKETIEQLEEKSLPEEAGGTEKPAAEMNPMELDEAAFQKWVESVEFHDPRLPRTFWFKGGKMHYTDGEAVRQVADIEEIEKGRSWKDGEFTKSIVVTGVKAAHLMSTKDNYRRPLQIQEKARR